MKYAVIVAVVALSAVIAHGQVLSMSRFSSSGLVFPGPPNQKPQQRSDGSEQMTRRSAQGPQPVRVRSQQKLPAVPLSMIGKQPEEFIAAAQQRQLQQQQEEQQRAQQAAQVAPKQDTEEEEDEFASAEEEFLPRPAPVRPLQRQDVQRPVPRPQPQQREEPERPVRPQQQQQREEPTRIRPRPVQDVQRPEPSIQQPVQQRRPNYPANYKPRPQEVNDVEEERRRPAEPEREPEGDLPEEEEEEVKPDKLQILLQNTKFSCAEKKDGYYADEEVDCEVFHYCQDRIRHSWLCPEGAIFHQVHLICMPISKENICKKSSQFHFVNDYLYKPLQDEDGNNSTLYADRYYPDGYEPGFDMTDVDVQEKPKLQAYNRRPQNSEEAGNFKRRQPIRNENTRKNVEQRRPPFVPSDDQEDSFFKSPPAFRNENRRIGFRRPVPAEEDFSGEEDEE